MKIAFINFYQNKVPRGSETFVRELSLRLKEKHSVDVYSPKDSEVDWEKKDATNTILRFFFLDYWSIRIAIYTLRIVSKIVRDRTDIVIPLNGGWQPAIIRIATWLYGGRMIISGQSGIGWDDRNNLWSFPNTFVALSTKAKKWANKANPFVKNSYIPNGVSLDMFSEKGEVYKTGLKRPVVLCVGAFTKQKRLNLAIDAVSNLDGVSLLIAGGGGDLAGDIEKYAVNKLGSKRFKILTVSFSKMPEIYRSADVFTLPSATSEAFGNVLVEAMASGLPVVGVDDPVRREIVGDAGILVDPVNVYIYSKALSTAIKKSWGSIPRKQAEKFSWDKIAIKYENLFKKIVK